MNAEYGSRRIVVKEIVSVGERRYSYYILRGSFVEAGFDNSPDPQAIRLKFGRIGVEYAQERISHLHLENKQKLVLTDDIDFDYFLEWLIQNVPRT